MVPERAIRDYFKGDFHGQGCGVVVLGNVGREMLNILNASSRLTSALPLPRRLWVEVLRQT
jgi:hypothetical protein